MGSGRSSADPAFDEMVDTRRHLHSHPELGFEEYETTELIRDRLTSLGLSEEPAGTTTGAAFSLLGGRPGNPVVLRADIDALPVHEVGDLPFVSGTDGVMHACGHDEHTAALLGVARQLAERAEDVAGRYLFVFQPAEEKLDGARLMIEGGVLTGFEGARLIGHHVTSMFPVGFVAVRAGVAMSEAHSLRITLEGAGGHGAIPTGEGDVVQAAAAVVTGLGDVVSGLSYEGSDCVCSAGVIRAGHAVNVVPVRAVIEGTLRTFTESQRGDALLRLEELCGHVAEDFVVQATLEFPSHTPAVRNDPDVTAVIETVARTAIGADNVFALPPVGPSDDVSEFLNHLPGCYFFVGAGHHDGTSGIHHSPNFRIDEESLRISSAIMTEAAISLGEPSGRRPS